MKRYPPELPRQYVSGQGQVWRVVFGILILVVLFGSCGVLAGLKF